MLALSAFEIVGLVGTVVGVVGIGLTVFFYRHPRRTRRLRYVVATTKLFEGLDSKVDELKVTFRGAPVQTVSVSSILLWNAGTETLTDQDWTEDSLRVALEEESQLLDIKVVAQTTDASLVQIDGIADVAFDFLDPGHGAVLQVVHTGTKSKQVHLRGRLKGAGLPDRAKQTRDGMVFLVGTLAAAIFISLTLTVGPEVGKKFEGLNNFVGALAAIAGFLLYCGVVAAIIIPFYRPGPRDLRRQLPSSGVTID